MPRIISIWLPDLATDRLGGAFVQTGRRATSSPSSGRDESRPLVLVATVKNAQTVTAVDTAAAAAGLSPGMTLSHARALVPDVQSAPADPEGDRALLEKLAEWCGRYSPSCGIDDSAAACARDDFGLWIDSTGAAHLFGGEDPLLADLGRRLEGFGLRHRLGLADTPGAAWALARFHPTTQIVEGRGARDVLFELSAAGLRLTPETLTLLRRLGLKTVGQLAAIPRAALAKRFTSKEMGEAVLRRLDQLFAATEEPLTPRRPKPVYRAEQAFLDPLIEPEALTHGLALLTADLCRMLTKANQGAVRLAFLAFRVDGDVRTLRVGASLPTRDPVHIARLFAEKLPNLDPGFGIEKLALHAEHTAAIEKKQNTLKGGVTDITDPDERLAQLIDHLTARLGEDAVTITTPVETHIPECQGRGAPAATCKESALGRGDRASSFTSWEDMPCFEGRPSCLLLRPEPIRVLAEVPDGPPRRFTWRRVTHRIVKAEGPERIAGDALASADWAAETRNYYRVEDDHGRRYWLFRQGLYDTAGYAGLATEEDAISADQTNGPLRKDLDDRTSYPRPATEGDANAADHTDQVDAVGRADRPGWFIHGVFG